MAEIINLRRVRKRLGRQADAQEAAENRARFGRTRTERAADAATTDRAARLLDGARLAPGPQAPDAKLAKERDRTS